MFIDKVNYSVVYKFFQNFG